MTRVDLAIISTGMVTGVGLTAPSTCAALRAGIAGFAETRFLDRGGQWLLGCAVPLEQPLRGRAKLARMAAMVIRECLEAIPDAPSERIPLIVCVAEPDRPGRLDGLDDLLVEIQSELGHKFHSESRVLAEGHVAIAMALRVARAVVYRADCPYCLIVGVDTLLVAQALVTYEDKVRLLTSRNSNGFIAGEGAAGILVGRPRHVPGEILLMGIGAAQEEAAIESGEPLRAEGMAAAIQGAREDGATALADLDYRITDLNGEQYGFKEAALALTRLLRVRKERFDIWHPADCIGEVGAAIGPCALAVATAAAQKGYAPGPGVLCHFSNDDGRRAALVLRAGNGRSG